MTEKLRITKETDTKENSEEITKAVDEQEAYQEIRDQWER